MLSVGNSTLVFITCLYGVRITHGGFTAVTWWIISNYTVGRCAMWLHYIIDHYCPRGSSFVSGFHLHKWMFSKIVGHACSYIERMAPESSVFCTHLGLCVPFCCCVVSFFCAWLIDLSWFIIKPLMLVVHKASTLMQSRHSACLLYFFPHFLSYLSWRLTYNDV